MSQQTQAPDSDLTELAEEARALLAATTDVAGEKINAARQRVSAALERAQEFAGRVRDQAVAGAKATDKAIHQHPYQAIAIGIGLGALVGYFIARRCTRDRE